MNENNIFSENILHNTVEYHIGKHSKKTNLIFWIIFFAILLIALSFISIDIYTTSPGVITSHEKPISLYAPVSERITCFIFIENKPVSKDDTLRIVNQKCDNLISSQKEDIKDLNPLKIIEL